MNHLECDALFIHKYKDKWVPWTQGMIHDRMRKIGKIIGLEDFHWSLHEEDSDQ